MAADELWILQVTGTCAPAAAGSWVRAEVVGVAGELTATLVFESRKLLVRWLRHHRELLDDADLRLHPPEKQVMQLVADAGVPTRQVRSELVDAVWVAASN